MTGREGAEILGRGSGGRDEDGLAVVAQLLDGFADVGQRPVVAALRGGAVERSGIPAAGELLDRADVDVAVVDEPLQLGHVPGQERPVGADGVAGERCRAGLGDVLPDVGQGLGLGVRHRRAGREQVEQSGSGVHIAHEVVHAGELLRRRRDDDVDTLAEDVQLAVGHQHRDLDQGVPGQVEACHLAIDPHQSVSHDSYSTGAGRR